MGGIGIAFLAGFLIVCNVVLGLVLVIKFKKTVSDKTNEVIGAAKREMELIIADMNRQTDRNITLFQNHQGELKALIAEADRHVTVARNEIEKLKQVNISPEQLKIGEEDKELIIEYINMFVA